jgi:hypothetical protein
LERLGWLGENPQSVVVPNDDDYDDGWELIYFKFWGDLALKEIIYFMVDFASWNKIY